MRFSSILVFLSLIAAQVALASENTTDDMFNVKEIKGSVAIVEGKAKSLKAGDKIYFARSPFVFSVAAVNGNLITVDIPASSDLNLGMSLVRNQTAAIKKGMDTEAKLKQALQE